MVIDHPPPIDPVSPEASSTMNSCHCPLGLWPLNVARVVADVGAGAGAGNVSGPLLSSRLVGWNVPDPSAPVAGSCPAAASSDVRVPVTGNPVSPFTSDMMRRFWPAGLTSSTSMSVAMACTTELSVTLTSTMFPVIPLTVMADGYGDAGPIWFGEPAAGTAIAAALLNVATSAPAIVGAPPISVEASTATTQRPARTPREHRRSSSWLMEPP